MFRRSGGGGGGGTGKGAAFEHFCCPLSGEFDHIFCPMPRTFEFDRPEDWVHLNLNVQSLGSETRVPGDAIWKISVSVKSACINYYIYKMQYRYSVSSRIQYNAKVVVGVEKTMAKLL